jgi:hypothetical protein
MKPVLLLHRNQRYHGFSNLQTSSLLLMPERGSPDANTLARPTHSLQNALYLQATKAAVASQEVLY